MNTFRKKIGFVLFASIMMFATTFGVGANMLASTFAPTTFTQEAESENSVEDVSAFADESSGVFNGYYTSQPTFSTPTVEITNSLFVYNSTNMLGDSIDGKTVQITNSIFVYTGTGSATLFDTAYAPASLTLNNVIFYASGSGSVSDSGIDYDMRKNGGFVYGNKTGNANVYCHGAADTDPVPLGKSLTNLLGEIGFLARNEYAGIKSDGEPVTLDIWSGAWSFTSEGWGYASGKVIINGENNSYNGAPDGVYPYPAKYLEENVINSAVRVWLYTNVEGEESSKVVVSLGLSDTINTGSPFTLTRNGYRHVGWYVYPDLIEEPTSDGAGGEFTEEVIIDSKDEGISLYAAWEKIGYTITYDFAGGATSDTGYTTKYTVTDEIKLPSSVTKTGYTFNGWSVSPTSECWETPISANTTTLAAGKYGKVTLEAQWKADVYKVEYNSNYPTDKTDTKIIDTVGIIYGNPYTFYIQTQTDFACDGYTLVGWTDSSTGTTSKWAAGSTATWTTDLKAQNNTLNLYAIWQGNSYNITYTLKGGTMDGSTADQTDTYTTGTTKTFPTNITKFGYNFAGWKLIKVNDGTANYGGWTVGNKYTGTNAAYYGNIILEAQWTPKAVTITYSANGLTFVSPTSVSNQNVNFDHTFTATTNPTVQIKGHYDQKWQTSQDTKITTGMKISSLASNNFTTSENGLVLALKAVATPEKYNVVYNSNYPDGTNTTKNDTNKITFGQSYTTMTEATSGFKIDGYKFQGWSRTDGEKNTVNYNAGVVIDSWTTDEGNNGAKLNLYAVWAVDTNYTYTITYANNDSDRDEVGYLSKDVNINITIIKQEDGNATIINGSNIAKGGSATITGQYLTDVKIRVQFSNAEENNKYYVSENSNIITNPDPENYTKRSDDGSSYYDFDITINSSGNTNLYVYQIYTITYNKGDGNVEGTLPAKGYKLHGCSYNIAQRSQSNGIYRNGYTFVEWKGSDNNSYNGGGTGTTTTATYITNKDLTLTAQWTGRKIEISFGPKTIVQDEVTYSISYGNYKIYLQYGDKDTVNAASGDSLKKPVAYVTQDGTAVTNTPVWVTYNGNDILNGQTNVLEEDWWSNLSDVSWGGTSDTSTITLAVNANNDSKLKLKITFNNSTITYTYDKEDTGVSGTPYPQSYSYDEDFTLSNNTSPNVFTRPGYQFAGWKVTSETAGGWEKGAEYTGGQQISKGTRFGDVTLTAIWTESQYQIEYDENGGNTLSGSGYTTTYYLSTSINLPTSTNTKKTGYTLAGWTATEVNGHSENGYSYGGWTVGTLYTNVGTGKYGDVTLTAKWNPITYTIELIGNGGKTSNSSTSTTINNVKYDQSVELTNNFTRPGYSFAGWARNANGSDKTGLTQTGDKWKALNLASTQGATVQVYAQWTAYNYTIRFSGQGGKTSDNETTYTQGGFVYNDSGVANQAMIANKFIRAGYNFAGWSRTENGAVNYNDKATSDKYLVPASNGATVDLYAVWTSQMLTITLNNDGGSANTTTIFLKYNVGFYSDKDGNNPITKLSAIPTKAGYTFAGYYTSKGDSATKIIEADGTIVSGKTTFTTTGTEIFAKWKANYIQVSINLNKGNGSTTPTFAHSSVYILYGDKTIYTGRNATDLTAPSGTEITDNFVPTRTGYNFKGWGTSANAITLLTGNDGILINNWTTSAADGDTLYAIWEAKQYTVTLNANSDVYETEVSAPSYSGGKETAEESPGLLL